MDAVSEHSFVLDLDKEVEIKPLPSVIKKPGVKAERLKVPRAYPKYELEFYETIQTCGEYIDKLSSVEERVKYHKELNKIFLIRHRGSAMKLFRELYNLTIKGGHHGQS